MLRTYGFRMVYTWISQIDFFNQNLMFTRKCWGHDFPVLVSVHVLICCTGVEEHIYILSNINHAVWTFKLLGKSESFIFLCPYNKLQFCIFFSCWFKQDIVHSFLTSCSSWSSSPVPANGITSSWMPSTPLQRMERDLINMHPILQLKLACQWWAGRLVQIRWSDDLLNSLSCACQLSSLFPFFIVKQLTLMQYYIMHTFKHQMDYPIYLPLEFGNSLDSMDCRNTKEHPIE